MTIDLTEAERRNLAFAVAVFVEDTEKELKKRGIKEGHAVRRVSELERFRLLKLQPEALCGALRLADGSTIKPGDAYTPPED
jgi:hypothetical protein